MKKTYLSKAVSLLLFSSASAVAFAQNVTTGPFGFEPIDGSANSADYNAAAPWKIPQGFSQTIVTNEENLNIYPNGLDDWYDMNTVNENGKHAGQFLYTTHEVRLETPGEDGTYPEGGAVSVLDLKTGQAKIIAQDPTWTALDGIRWTPWGTILFAEESTNGRLFEMFLDKKDPSTAAEVVERPAVGLLAHEGIAIGADGSVYVVDEFRGDSTGFGGGVYRFVPDTYGDLSSGELYALQADNADGTGNARWVGPIDPLTARTSGTEAGGTGYQRPEDLEVIGDTLYVAVTEGNPDGTNTEAGQYQGRVLAVNLDSMVVTNFVKPGVNVPVEIGNPTTEGNQTGFDGPDNLAQTPDGKLVIVEDNTASDIWIAIDNDNDGVADSVNLFASLTDYAAEGTGIYFGKDPKVMFVNVQHSQEADGDGVWAIRKED